MLHPIKNEKGAALVTVIIAMVVLGLLGAALLQLGVSETIMSVANEQQIQAEYVAKTGADIAAKIVIDDATTTTSSVSGQVGEGTYLATITRPDADTIIITSIGTVDEETRSVTLEMNAYTYQSLFTGIRQTGEDDLDLSAMDITHDPGDVVLIEANVQDLSQITLDSVAEADPEVATALNNTDPPPIVYPDTTSYQTTVPIPVGTTYTFTGDYVLTSLIKTNNDTLIFDTQGTDMHIVTNTLDFAGSQGEIIVQGGGYVHIYVLDSGDIQTPVKVNQDDPGVLFLYIADGKTLEISANGTINAYIYSPYATVEIQSDLTMVKGAIVGQIINRGNVNGAKGNFHYIPLEDNPDETSIQPRFKKVLYSN